ncbi:hypothetical protein [Nitrosomonas sp.]|uniref:hypothetical protein n=1 Tax=Nitrosomonas sp. TaxID=42353 RepID=UPI0025CEE7CD|nr:hypothetical protein [Nitrosomonas sp.]
MSISQIKQAEKRADQYPQETEHEAELKRLQEYADGRDICIDMLLQRCDDKETEVVKEKVKTKIMSILCATLTASALLYILIINYF